MRSALPPRIGKRRTSHTQSPSRLGRLLQKAYPAEWRRHYGRDLISTIDEMRQLGTFRFVDLIDVVTVGFVERLGAIVRPHPRTSQTTTAMFVGIVFALGIVLMPGQVDTSSQAKTPSEHTSLRSAPGTGATLAQWQAYAAKQRATVQSVNWLTAVSSPGCTVTSATVAPIDGTAPGVPLGVVTDGVVIEGRCGAAPPRSDRGS